MSVELTPLQPPSSFSDTSPQDQGSGSAAMVRGSVEGVAERGDDDDAKCKERKTLLSKHIGCDAKDGGGFEGGNGGEEAEYYDGEKVSWRIVHEVFVLVCARVHVCMCACMDLLLFVFACVLMCVNV